MLTNLSKETWDQKVIELGGSILQSWAWGEFQASLGQKIYRFSGDDFVCLGIETDLPLGKKYIYCPRGPLGNTKEALFDLKKLETDHSLIFTRLEPYQAVDLPHALKDVQPAHEWALDLEKSEEELLISMKPKTRYNINLAQRKGITIREGTKEDLLIFWQLMLETASRQGIRLHPQNYYWQMWESLAPVNMKLLLAEYQGQALAGMLLTQFSDTAYYLHGGTSARMKEAMAPYLLHWEAIRIAKFLGFKYYNFGGMGAAGWEGITRFKQGFGGFEIHYPGAFDLVFSPLWYNIYAQARHFKKLLR
jgi:peptidoglycan pentaglycine glycine transferase (the first glycine)